MFQPAHQHATSAKPAATRDVCPFCPTNNTLYTAMQGTHRLAICVKCASALNLPQNYHPSFLAYMSLTTALSIYLDTRIYLTQQRVKVREVWYKEDKATRQTLYAEVTRIDRVIEHHERSNYPYEILTSKRSFEWHLWYHYTSVNTPLPKAYMEFFNHDNG